MKTKILNKGVTVQELYKACAEQIKQGNGDRHILISSDDEGNGFHRMFFLFTPKEHFEYRYLATCSLPLDIDKDAYEKEYIVLG